MARHADVIRKPGLEFRGIDDGGSAAFRRRGGGPFNHFQNVRFAGAVAIFTADGQLLKWRLGETPIHIWNRARHSAVARDAARQNWAVKAVISEFVARRERPGMSFRVIGKWRLVQKI